MQQIIREHKNKQKSALTRFSLLLIFNPRLLLLNACVSCSLDQSTTCNEFTIILVSQSIFDNGRLSKGIRNNCEIWVLFRNFG